MNSTLVLTHCNRVTVKLDLSQAMANIVLKHLLNEMQTMFFTLTTQKN